MIPDIRLDTIYKAGYQISGRIPVQISGRISDIRTDTKYQAGYQISGRISDVRPDIRYQVGYQISDSIPDIRPDTIIEFYEIPAKLILSRVVRRMRERRYESFPTEHSTASVI